MTVEEFEKATEQDLRSKANQLFDYASHVGELVRTAVLTEARFYLEEIDRRDDRYRSRRDLVLELVVIGLILTEIVFSAVAYHAGKTEFAVLSNLEASSRATAGILADLKQSTEEMNKIAQEQAALSYEVAVHVRVNLPDNELEITNEGRTPVTLWGWKFLDESPVMLARPNILAPGAPHSLSAEKIVTVAVQQMKKHAASVSVVLFLKNEKSEEFVAHYVFVNRTGYGPFSLQTRALSVTRSLWSSRAK